MTKFIYPLLALLAMIPLQNQTQPVVMRNAEKGILRKKLPKRITSKNQQRFMLISDPQLFEFSTNFERVGRWRHGDEFSWQEEARWDLEHSQ